MSEEDKVRKAAFDCLEAWRQTTRKEPAAGMHAACSVLWVEPGGTTYQSCRGSEFELSREETPFSVVSVKIMPVGNQSAAAVHVTTAGASVAGWMVFLKTAAWQCISAAFACNTAVVVVLPDDFAHVIEDMAWNGYCAANRACDGARMAQFFHQTCRLTFVNDDNEVEIMNQQTFCDMVTHRYERPPHAAFRHLQENDHSRRVVASQDSLLAVDFATPTLALVTLKVGHPPYLWTDYLTVAALDGGGQKWWIVHKSSCHERFLEDERKGE